MKLFSRSVLAGFVPVVLLTSCDPGTDPVPVAEVAVTAPSSILAVGHTLTLSATPRDASGRELSGRAVVWSSSDEAVAVVDSEGMVTAKSPGIAAITATVEARSGSMSLTIAPAPVASVSVSPDSAIVHPGSTRQLSAILKDAAGNALSDRTVTWSSSDSTRAKVSSTGAVTGVAIGEAIITATSQGRSATAGVTVQPVPIASLAIEPATATIPIGGAVQLSIVARDSAGNLLAGRAGTISSSDTAVAPVNPSKVVTGRAAGTANITVVAEGKTATAVVTVAPPRVADVQVTPGADTLIVGDSARFRAILRDSTGAILRDRKVEWAVIQPSRVAPPGYATVDQTGRVAALGTPALSTAAVEIRATSEGIFGSAHLVIYRKPVRVEVYGTTRLLPDREAQLRVAILDESGYAIDAPSLLRLSSSDPTVLGVTPSGVISAKRVGRATIEAKAGEITGRLDVQITGSGYHITPLGTLGGKTSRATGINDLGQVVGESEAAGGETRAFLWQNGTMTSLVSAGLASRAAGINNKGQVVGGYSADRYCSRAFVWQNGRVTDLLGEQCGFATAINDSSQVVGSKGSTRFLWHDGRVTSLGGESSYLSFGEVGGINNHGRVVGSSAAMYSAALSWQNGNTTVLPGLFRYAHAGGINDAGQVVGLSEVAHGRTEAVLWQDAKPIRLGSLGGSAERIFGINNKLQAVGTEVQNREGRGFLWQNGGMVDLTLLLADTSWAISEATAINEAGQIVGRARNLTTGATVAVLLTPVR